MTNSAEVIFCVVNQGYEEKVISVAHSVGITGGTFLNARGLAKQEAEKFFGISIHQEKQVVLMVVPSTKKADILSALYDEVGMDQEAQGIAIAIPVDDMTENLKKQLFSKPQKEHKEPKETKENKEDKPE